MKIGSLLSGYKLFKIPFLTTSIWTKTLYEQFWNIFIIYIGYFGSHFVFAYILNYSTLTKFQLSVWSSVMPKETESIKKKLNTSKQGQAPNLGLAAGLEGAEGFVGKMVNSE